MERYRTHPEAAVYYLTYSVVEWLPVFVTEATFRIVALRDLAGPKLWEKSFVELVAQLFEKDHSKYRYALEVLHTHRADWVEDQKLAHRLSAVVFKELPFLKKPIKAETAVGSGWASGVAELAKTGDRAVIELLRPRLDDKRELPGKRFRDALGRVLPHRACDVALEAILTLLDGDSQATYRRAGTEKLTFGRGGEAAWNDLRDRMIVELKKRLEKEPPR
jgi:hypothetical protein